QYDIRLPFVWQLSRDVEEEPCGSATPCSTTMRVGTGISGRPLASTPKERVPGLAHTKRPCGVGTTPNTLGLRPRFAAPTPAPRSFKAQPRDIRNSGCAPSGAKASSRICRCTTDLDCQSQPANRASSSRG